MNVIFRKIRGNKGCNQIQNKPARRKNRYDGTLESLADKSHRYPNEHTADEFKFIADMRKRNINTGGKIASEKLYTLGNGSVPSFVPSRANGS